MGTEQYTDSEPPLPPPFLKKNNKPILGKPTSNVSKAQCKMSNSGQSMLPSLRHPAETAAGFENKWVYFQWENKLSSLLDSGQKSQLSKKAGLMLGQPNDAIQQLCFPRNLNKVCNNVNNNS